MPIEKKYPKEFYAARPLVLERAQNRCEECGAENYKPHPVSGKLVRLQVHHIDGNIANNAPENLRAMCASCHIKAQKICGKTQKICGTGNSPVNRAETGIFAENKKSEKNENLRHGELARQSVKVPLEKIESFRVFVAENKCKLKKAGLYVQLAQLAGELSMPQRADSGNSPVNRAETPTTGFVRIGETALIAGELPQSVSKEARKEERKRRKQEKAKRKGERDAYAAKMDAGAEARREAAEADSEEPPAPRKKKEGNINWPYYAQFRRDGIRYRASDGKAVNALTGELLNHAQEFELIFGVKYAGESTKTNEAA